MKITYEEAAQKVIARSVEDPDEGCFRWTGPVNVDGYGRTFNINGRFVSPHRIVYVAATGAPIPDGMTLDHVCHTRSECIGGDGCLHRRCVNPDHLEAVTAGENGRRSWRARKPACKRGHPFDEANTYVAPGLPPGTIRRACRACMRINTAQYKQRQMLRAAGITERAA